MGIQPPQVLPPSLPLNTAVDSKPPGNSNSFTHWPPIINCVLPAVCAMLPAPLRVISTLPALVGCDGV